MRSASGGPRVLLRRLRETMAEQVSAQERLDKIVVLIAAHMVAEACSTYVLRVDNTLEPTPRRPQSRCGAPHVLSAMKAWSPRSSEATPLNLNDAQSHPAFSFRPRPAKKYTLVSRRSDPARRQYARGVVVQNRASAPTSRKRSRRCDHRHGAAEMIAGRTRGAREPGVEPPHGTRAQDRRDPVRRHCAWPCVAA